MEQSQRGREGGGERNCVSCPSNRKHGNIPERHSNPLSPFKIQKVIVWMNIWNSGKHALWIIVRHVQFSLRDHNISASKIF